MEFFIASKLPRNLTTFEKVSAGESFMIGEGKEVYLRLDQGADYVCVSEGTIYQTGHKTLITIVTITAQVTESAAHRMTYMEFMDQYGPSPGM